MFSFHFFQFYLQILPLNFIFLLSNDIIFLVFYFTAISFYILVSITSLSEAINDKVVIFSSSSPVDHPAYLLKSRHYPGDHTVAIGSICSSQKHLASPCLAFIVVQYSGMSLSNPLRKSRSNLQLV